MFIGKFSHTLDPKGRIILPAKYREELGGHVVLAPGIDGCIFCYPLPEWEKFATQLMSLPGTASNRQVQRYFMSNAYDIEPDPQGRILLPADLKDKAGLEREIISVGMRNRIEIWSPERYNASQSTIGLSEAIDEIGKAGITF